MFFIWSSSVVPGFLPVNHNVAEGPAIYEGGDTLVHWDMW